MVKLRSPNNQETQEEGPLFFLKSCLLNREVHGTAGCCEKCQKARFRLDCVAAEEDELCCIAFGVPELWKKQRRIRRRRQLVDGLAGTD